MAAMEKWRLRMWSVGAVVVVERRNGWRVGVRSGYWDGGAESWKVL